MGACTGCGQLVLVLINLLFSLVGLTLLVVACLVKTGSGVFDSLLSDAYNKFLVAVKEAAQSQQFHINDLDIGKIVGDAAIAFIAIGAFFFLLGIFGCFGAVCKHRILLTIYAIVLAVVFLVEVVFVVLLFTIKSKIDQWIQEPMIQTLKEDYSGTNGTDIFTTTINFVMHQMECCGIDNYTEFAEATNWGYDKGTRVIPYICCRADSDTTDCVSHPASNNSYIDQGCYTAVNNWLTDQRHVLIGIGSGVAAVQVLLIIFSIVICCQARREDHDDDDDDDKMSYNDQFPIQPYREPPELQGHKNLSYDSGPYGSQPDIGVQYYRGDSRASQQLGYNDSVTYYQGRTDRYNGPPQGYRR